MYILIYIYLYTYTCKLYTNFFSALSEEEAQTLIDSIDIDGDGDINFSEFVQMINDGVIGWRFRTGYRVVFLMGG